jgi:tRNA_anti-like
MKRDTKQKLKWALLIVTIPCTIGSIYGWQEFNRKHVATEEIKPAFTKTAAELVKDFETDETSADKMYTDKVVAVKGSILKIENNDSIHNIVLKGTTAMSSVLCQFEKNDTGIFENKKEGDEIIIKGVCTGLLMDVILVRCALAE